MTTRAGHRDGRSVRCGVPPPTDMLLTSLCARRFSKQARMNQPARGLVIASRASNRRVGVECGPSGKDVGPLIREMLIYADEQRAAGRVARRTTPGVGNWACGNPGDGFGSL